MEKEKGERCDTQESNGSGIRNLISNPNPADPKCSEITWLLFPGQNAIQSHEITARVF